MWEELQIWAETYRRPFIQEVTYLKYGRTVELIKEFFGNKKTNEIKRIDLQKFFNLLSSKYGKRTIKTHYQHVMAFYQSLVDDGEIDRNPMNNIRFSGVEKKKKKKFLEAGDANRLLKFLDLNDSNDLMIYISLKTGMRFAEVLGLTPDDLYIENNMHMMSINKTLDYKVTKNFKTTKTVSSIRDISIDKELYATLTKFYQRQEVKANESIFGVKATATLNKRLKQICEGNDIEVISFHGLRHTHGSLLLMQGIPMISVSKRLGHASLSITQDIYIHLMKEQEQSDNRSIVKLMEAI